MGCNWVDVGANGCMGCNPVHWVYLGACGVIGCIGCSHVDKMKLGAWGNIGCLGCNWVHGL